MTAISDSVPLAVRRTPPRFAEWARWAVLGVAFVVSGIVLGCGAAIRAPRPI